MAQQFKLSDGRNFDYCVSGAHDGFPLVWIHGTPGSYFQDPSLVAVCKKKDIKLISYSRAGYGGSSRRKGRRVVDSVEDTNELLEHLGVKRCLVGGWSGGGPHALACAARLNSCVAVLCVAGGAPYNAEGLDYLAGQGEDNIEEFNAALKGEEEVRKFCNAQRPEMIKNDPAALTEAMASLLPEVDRKALQNDPEMDRFMAATIAEALRIGVDGWVDDDMEQLVNPWGFELSEVKVPVFLYQGSADKMVPYAHGVWLADHLPQDKVRKHLLQNEGHISIFVGQRDAMLDELLAVEKH